MHRAAAATTSARAACLGAAAAARARALAPHTTPRTAGLLLSGSRPSLSAATAFADEGDAPSSSSVDQLTSAALLAATGGARTAAQGDTVSVHYALKDEDGTVLDSSQARNEPVRAWGMGVVCVRGREN